MEDHIDKDISRKYCLRFGIISEKEICNCCTIEKNR